MTKRTVVSMATTVLVVALASGAAFAHDWYIHPGAACEAETSSSVTDRVNGIFKNASGSSIDAYCPVPKVRNDSTPASVSLVTTTGIDADDCRVTVRPFDGSTPSSYAHDSIVSQGTGRQQIIFDSGLPTLSSNATITIRCENVPNNETIYNYHLDE